MWNAAKDLFERSVKRNTSPDIDESYLNSQGSSRQQELDEYLMELNLSFFYQDLSIFETTDRGILHFFSGTLALNLTTGSP